MARLYKRSRKTVDHNAPDQISFLLNDELVKLDDVDPGLTILDFLRKHKNLNATKRGCEQGGCGSCTVSVGEMLGSTIQYNAVNSCIGYVASLHNKHLVTVEGISKKGKLHPAQQCLLLAHGSQCGFCTPGMVMSLYTMCYNRDDSSKKLKINDTLSGNLCRCTGYRPIFAAAQKLLKRKNLSSFGYEQQQVLAKLKKTPYKKAQTFIHKNTTYHSPITSNDVAQLILKHPGASLVAGGTGSCVNLGEQQKKPKRIISLERVSQLKLIRKGKDMFAFGAGVTLNEISNVIGQDYPDLKELIRRFGSQQIRNRATMIGNIATADSGADLPPALIVLDAKITLRVGNFRRFLKLEDFFISASKRNIKKGEFIESLQIPRARRPSIYHAYKLSKRFDNDMSTICGAFFLLLDNENVVRDIRICFSGMTGFPKRASRVEQGLAQEQWSLENINKVLAFFDKDYQPQSDCRGSDDYRMTAAKNLIKRFYLETQSDSIPTRLTGEIIDH